MMIRIKKASQQSVLFLFKRKRNPQFQCEIAILYSRDSTVFVHNDNSHDRKILFEDGALI